MADFATGKFSGSFVFATWQNIAPLSGTMALLTAHMFGKSLIFSHNPVQHLGLAPAEQLLYVQQVVAAQVDDLLLIVFEPPLLETLRPGSLPSIVAQVEVQQWRPSTWSMSKCPQHEHVLGLLAHC